MTAKGNNVEIISFSAPKKLAREIDLLTKEMGYSTRSEFIRVGLRMHLRSKKEMDTIKGKLEGVIIALYSHSAEGEISEIRHRNMDIIKSFMHSDFKEKVTKCCDVLIYAGDAERVRTMVYELETVRNVEEVSLFVA